MTVTTLESQLTAFREKYSSIKVTAFADCLVYKCARGMSQKSADAANKLIDEMGLPLVAIANKFPSDDSYVVKSQNSVDI